MTGGIIEVYAKCPYCGADGVRVRKVISYAKQIDANIVVHKTQGRGAESAQVSQKGYLDRAKISGKPSIVVIDGDEVIRLDAWKP